MIFDLCKKVSGWRNPPREKPGMCPPANHEVRWPNLGWGKEWKEDGDIKGNKFVINTALINRSQPLLI